MADKPSPRGLYFEEFEDGYETETPARTVTEADVVAFAGLSGDFNPLHTNAEFAKTTLYEERIAHGLLGLSIASGLANQLGFMDGTAQAFTHLEWKFRGPILLGDTIHAKIAVKKKKAMKQLNGGFVFFDLTLVNQKDEVVQKGTWTVLVLSAP
jgi:3-hydroxybutyryl-CoA dehydratase